MKANLSTKQMISSLIAIIVVISVIGYWWYEEKYVSTNDAYVNANVVQIAPRITGQVSQLNVVNNQHVKMGQLLFVIDPTPFQVALDKAHAELQETYQVVAENEAAVSASEAGVLVQKTALNHAQVTAARILSLVKQNVLPAQSGDDATASLKSAEADYVLAKAQLQQAQFALATAQTKVKVVKAAVAQAELDLQYTRVVAPSSGQIANLSMREGDVISLGQPLFALINDSEYWVDANYKESDLAAIKLGQKADVVVDVYSHHHFSGVVESISGGAGVAFSLLPPENATGNWVKVTQRVPVRILIQNPDKNYPLQIGTSATVIIDTTQAVN